MEYIKSCGFVVFKRSHGEIHYLIIRELKEETNIEVQIVNGFREQVEYKFPKRENVIKQ